MGSLGPHHRYCQLRSAVWAGKSDWWFGAQEVRVFPMFAQERCFYNASVPEEWSASSSSEAARHRRVGETARAVCRGALRNVSYHCSCRNLDSDCPWRPLRLASDRCPRVTRFDEATADQQVGHRRTGQARRWRACRSRRTSWPRRTRIQWEACRASDERSNRAHHERAPQNQCDRQSPHQRRQSACRPAGPALGTPALLRQGRRGRRARDRHPGGHRRCSASGTWPKSLLVLVQQQQDTWLLGLLQPTRLTPALGVCGTISVSPAPGGAALSFTQLHCAGLVLVDRARIDL